MLASELIEELEGRSHLFLFHACTLPTFRSYCELGGYRSRSAVRAAGKALTPQVSDDDDDRLGIADHLFLNIFDQHGDVHKGKSVTGLNKYGPLLMVFDVRAIAGHTGEFRGYRQEITSATYNREKHDILLITDFRNETFARPFDKMSAPLRRPGTRGPNMCVHAKEEADGIPFVPFLREVIIDALPDSLRHLQDRALSEARELCEEYAPQAIVRLRECIPRCGCRGAYPSMSARDVERFFFVTNTHVYPMNLPRSI